MRLQSFALTLAPLLGLLSTSHAAFGAAPAASPAAAAAAPKKSEPAKVDPKKAPKKGAPAASPAPAPPPPTKAQTAGLPGGLPAPAPPPPGKSAAVAPAPAPAAPAPAAAPEAPRVEAATSSVPSPDAPADASPSATARGDWTASVDYSFGGATLDVLSDNELRPRELRPTNTFDSSRVTSHAIVLGVSYDWSKRLAIGLRAPLMQGTITPRSGDRSDRTSLVFGNVGLGANYKLSPAENLDLLVGAELTLPTGGGTESSTRADVAASPRAARKYAAIDRFSVARSADYARGSMDSGLFESGRVGLSPAATAIWRRGALTVRPRVMIEPLVDVTGDAPEGMIVDAVARAEAGYLVHPMIEPELAAWANWQITKHEFRDASAVVVEPAVRGHFGWFQPRAAVDFPVVGGLSDARAIALRLGATGNF